MQFSLSESVAVASALQNKFVSPLAHTDVVVCPSFPALLSVGQVVSASLIKLGAQNVASEEKGAFTGEVSVRDLEETQTSFVLLGHSECRTHLKETNEMVAKKFVCVLKSSVVPVLCVGESSEERKKDAWKEVLQEQLSAVFSGVEIGKEQEVVIAYEPVWAIGTGETCSVADAVTAAVFIRKTVSGYVLDSWVEKHLHILYGGSVDEKNVADFVKEKEIDGVLVGGASIDAERFATLIERVNAATL